MSTIIRKIDKLGRIVLPMDFRKSLGLGVEAEVAIEMHDKSITIVKKGTVCRLCGSPNAIDHFFCICTDCIQKIKTL